MTLLAIGALCPCVYVYVSAAAATVQLNTICTQFHMWKDIKFAVVHYVDFPNWSLLLTAAAAMVKMVYIEQQ